MSDDPVDLERYPRELTEWQRNARTIVLAVFSLAALVALAMNFLH